MHSLFFVTLKLFFVGTNNLDYSYMRTTALLAICRRLWIGTGTGVIISVPLSGSKSMFQALPN